MIAVKTHMSIDLPQSVSISGAVINLSLQARTTDVQCCNFPPSISPLNMCIFSKHYNEITWFLFSIETYCISSINEQRSRLTHLSSLITYNYSSLAGITKILSIITEVQPRPDIRSNSVLFLFKESCAIPSVENTWVNISLCDLWYLVHFSSQCVKTKTITSH